MRRVVTLVVLILLAMLSFAPSADAVVFDAEHTDGSCTFDCTQMDVLEMRGFIDCTAGMTYLIRANLRQAGVSRAIGKASGTCTGSVQGWVTSEVRNLSAIACGYFAADGQARTSQDGHQLLMDSNVFSACSA